MKRVVLTGLLLLAVALGVTGGYLTGDYLDRPLPTASGNAAPLGDPPTPTEPTVPVKTPIPNKLEPLETGLGYSDRTFTVHPEGNQAVQLSIEVPQGWRLTRDPTIPGEVKFLDKLRERGVRVEAVEPVQQAPADAMAELIVNLRKSQAPENDFRILSQTTGLVDGDDGGSRAVATLVYTYIPKETLRYVIVRWIAIDGEQTNVEMSITGVPEDTAALQEILKTATSSVKEVS